MLLRYREAEYALPREFDRRVAVGIERQLSIRCLFEMIVVELVGPRHKLRRSKERADVVREDIEDSGQLLIRIKRSHFRYPRGHRSEDVFGRLVIMLAHSGQKPNAALFATDPMGAQMLAHLGHPVGGIRHVVCDGNGRLLFQVLAGKGAGGHGGSGKASQRAMENEFPESYFCRLALRNGNTRWR